MDRDGGMTGGRLARYPGGVRVGVGPRPRLQAVGQRPGRRVCDDLDSDRLTVVNGVGAGSDLGSDSF